jgi:hypothetical protein
MQAYLPRGPKLRSKRSARFVARVLAAPAVGNSGQGDRQIAIAEDPTTASVPKPVGSGSSRRIFSAAQGNECHNGSEQPRIAQHDRLQGTAAKALGDR